MSDISIRIQGCAGRITLTRETALNALNHQMCLDIEAALEAWRADDAVKLVIIDAEGDRAFCAGGDIAQMYHEGVKGNAKAAQDFFRDEYRMNAKLAEYDKPIVSFMHGFIMGGGVGLGGHVAHRVLCESSQVAMPECGIGLIPDVGGSLFLARAPGRLGEYLGLTGARLAAADALYAGFGDYFIPQDRWADIIAALCDTGDLAPLEEAHEPQDAPIKPQQAEIDTLFAGTTLAKILANWPQEGSELAAKAHKALLRGSPLSAACSLNIIAHSRSENTIRGALEGEFRFTYRAVDESDFLEGVRAALIDKDRSPKWRHADASDLTAAEVDALTGPLGAQELNWT